MKTAKRKFHWTIEPMNMPHYAVRGEASTLDEAIDTLKKEADKYSDSNPEIWENYAVIGYVLKPITRKGMTYQKLVYDTTFGAYQRLAYDAAVDEDIDFPEFTIYGCPGN